MSPLMALLVACAPDGEVDPAGVEDLSTCEDPGGTEVWLMRQIWIARPDEEGRSEGFNLDGFVSTGGGSTGCGVADYTDPDGTPGIDNALAALMPALELTEAAAVEEILATQIEEGELLITLELTDVDARDEDGCVGLAVGQAVGAPDIGTDGLILSGQTFDRDTVAPVSEVSDAFIGGGRLLATGFDLRLPVQVFDVAFEVGIDDSSIVLEFDDEGGATGYFGGAIDVGVMLEVAATENVADEVLETLDAYLGYVLDLDPDENGVCQSLSATFAFEATPAFFFAEPP